MKVLLYAHSFAPNVGGAETQVLLVANGLSDRTRLTVATNTAKGACDDTRFPFAVVRRPGVRAIWRLIGDADVVHLAGPVLGPLAMGYLQRKPVVVEHHGYQAICPNGLLVEAPGGTPCSGHFMEARYGACLRCRASTASWPGGLRSTALTFVRRWLLRRVRENVAITNHVAVRLGLVRTRTIYYGVTGGAIASRAGDEADTPHPSFLFVGRLVREKGVDVLLRATAKLVDRGDDVGVRIVGDGPDRSRLEALTADLGLLAVVEFSGTLQGAALDRARDEAIALVMPSVWEETAGLSAIEAMRRGMPLIASAIGGLEEIVNGSGVLVEPGDAEALATAMRDLLHDPRRRAELGREARRRAEAAFAVERMIEEHAALWARVATR